MSNEKLPVLADLSELPHGTRQFTIVHKNGLAQKISPVFAVSCFPGHTCWQCQVDKSRNQTSTDGAIWYGYVPEATESSNCCSAVIDNIPVVQ